MFAASPFTPRKASSAGLAHSYHQVGVHTGVAGATPHRLVGMLFDGLQSFITQAQGAIAQGDVAAKCEAISRAVNIVDEGLRSALDLERGGQIAADLHDLYNYVSLRLVQANLHTSTETLEECKRLIEPLREAWAAIGPQVEGAPAR
jgi:flagellar protein FliS